MKVTRGSLVVMKGKTNRSLYALEGSTISGSMNVSTSIMSNEETKLWNLRLDHMDEKSLHELCKKGLFGKKKLENLGFCEHCVYGKH